MGYGTAPGANLKVGSLFVACVIRITWYNGKYKTRKGETVAKKLYDTVFRFMIQQWLADAVKKAAAEQGITVAQLIRDALVAHVGNKQT